VKPHRKHIITLLFALLGFSSAFAQTYGNEWIEYNKTYYKFNVARQGIYRIPYSALSTLDNINTVQGSAFNLFNMGNTIPYYFYDANNSGFFDDPGDFIEFYGKPNDGSFDTQLYPDPAYQTNNAISLFNDTAVYFLAWNTVKPNILIANIQNNLSGVLPAKEQYFMNVVRENGLSEPQLGKPIPVGNGETVHESIFDEGEGLTRGRFNSNDAVNLSTPNIFTTAPVSAALSFTVIGLNSTQHNLTYKFNSLTLGNDQFNNFKVNSHAYTIPLNSITANNLFIASASASIVDYNAIAYAEIIYPSQFKFSNNSRAYINLNSSSAARYLEITDFNHQNTDPILYDITNKMRLTATFGPTLKYRLPSQSANANRELFVTSQNSANLLNITTLERVNFVNYYIQQVNQGDYIILTHPKFNDINNYPLKYAKYRESNDGGDHTVVIALINQLYDQFGYGIRKHPLAIRNFIDFALNHWNTKPEHLFIIGKGREYWQQESGQFRLVRSQALIHAQCLVPTFGKPGSDALLTATSDSISPRLAVGRLSVENSADIDHYLEKVIAYERLQRETGDPYQTIEGKVPMKRIMHMAGGAGEGQQMQFKAFLEDYEDIIEDTLFGGDVYTFYKTSSAPIQIVQSDFIRELINTGVSLITFFGHSSANSFDFSIDDPDNLTNFGRYPVILSNGCYTGNIYNSSPGISEDFVLTPDKAAIAFISTIGFSSSSGLYYFSRNFYENLGQHHYGATLGQIMQHSVADIENFNGSPLNKTIAEEMTLHGDPGLQVNPHAKPDYALEAQNVSFIPTNVTVSQDSFQMRVILVNLGRAIKDSIDISVTRYFPGTSGGGVEYVKRIRGTYFSDTVYFNIPTGSSSSFGLNEFRIKVDNGDEISELTENNNELRGLTLNITSEDVFPIYPYEFAIVPTVPVTLKASTANPFAAAHTYRMEIDTTELFNSPLLTSTTITQSGGVLTWIPSMTYTSNVVYYWRVGIDGANSYNNSSFIYLKDEYPGWNQSHYYQFQKDNYNTLFLDSDSVFKFIGDVKGVSVKTGKANISGGGPVPWDQIAYYLNNALKHTWVCGGGGFSGGLVLAVFDSASGNNWISRYADVVSDQLGFEYNSIYKNRHCKDRDFEGFDFPTSGAILQQRIVDFIASVPDGNYIFAYSVNSAGYSGWGQPLIDAFQNLGSQELTPASLLSGSDIPWAFFAKKGSPNTATEMRKLNSTEILEFSASFSAYWNQGTITTPLIGPAYEWGSMHWRYHAMEPQMYDQQSVDIIGVTQSGSEILIDSNVANLDYSIQNINASTYPYIKLRLDTRDDTTRTPTQLDYWRVLYKKVPEAALNPAFNFAFRDSINLGEPLDLTMAVENVTDVPMDSLLVKYTLISTGNSAVNEYVRYDSLHALETMNLNWLFNTDCNCLGDVNTLTVEVNPIPKNSTTNKYDQLEQFHFNNIASLQFKLDKDRINPLLDVTLTECIFFDGDIVSAEPEILIRLKDENKYLLLDDTSLINIFIINPAKVQSQLRYDGVTMQFTPASGSGNTAEVRLKKMFETDGEYTLLVQAKDRSRNVSGSYGLPQEGIDYRISFEVIREAMITNVLNYPNPFTSSTRFVFTLTGIQPPDFFKIQIMTVSGKIVRELTQADLGPIHVGKNITEYAWNGTDEYGDPLANGLYLYRVVASLDGEMLNKWKNGPDKTTDKYFKSGFGKMYLAR